MSSKERAQKNDFLSPLLVGCCRLIPSRSRKFFFTTAALVYYYFFPRHRLLALYNLQTSFPEKAKAEIAALAKEVYRNAAIVGAELFDIPSLNKDNIKDWVEVEGLENYHQALEKGRGAILISAHFGNWELSAAALPFLRQPIVPVYRPLDNALLDNIILRIRSATGNVPLSKTRALRQMLRHLKNNMILGLLIDQNVARQEGVFVDYFSRPACTTDSAAPLALRTKAPVLPLFNLRLPNGKYRLILGKELPLVETGDWDGDVLVNTQNYTRVIEEMVRKHPDHWLWVHHRWKTKAWQNN